MLVSIQISNYVLIDSLDISFRQGFSVLTGQTGAGKSIILGALSLLMGQRAESRIISNGADKCTVEGHFDLTGYGLQTMFDEFGLDYDENDTIFRREVTKTGKSRAFINDTPVSLTVLKEIGSRLIDIHSQHQNLLLGTEAFQTHVTDTIAGDSELLAEYRSCFSQYKESLSDLDRLKEEAAQSRNEQDYMQFQFDELEKASLSGNEQQELENEQEMLSHAEDIKASLYQSADILDGNDGSAIPSVREALAALRPASRNLQSAAALSERLESCLIELRDISAEATRTEESIVFSQERLENVTERLNTIYTLQQKHNCDSVQALIEIRDRLGQRLERIDTFNDEIERLSRHCDSLRVGMTTLAGRLTESRKKAAISIGSRISQMLIPLGIKGAQFIVEVVSRNEFDNNGADRIRFLFSANQGQTIQELSEVASGGELSRVMLSLKSLMAGIKGLPTIIFDEIDTGVSGAVAEKMALMMRDMCIGGRQVIAISHLPQIAAKSDAHYLVFKEEDADAGATRTSISELDNNQRIMEIARMMSGEKITDAAIDNARALINN